VVDRELDALVPQLRAKRLRPSWEHARISKARADHDRVSKLDLERALFRAGLASSGQQSEAARVIGVTEGALRHWRDVAMVKVLPPKTAIVALSAYTKKRQLSRRVAG
jgi:hypothetical protein